MFTLKTLKRQQAATHHNISMNTKIENVLQYFKIFLMKKFNCAEGWSYNAWCASWNTSTVGIWKKEKPSG
jgi:hypothetical protein